MTTTRFVFAGNRRDKLARRTTCGGLLIATCLVLRLGAAPGSPDEAGASRAASPALKTIDQAELHRSVSTTAKELLIPGAVVLLQTPQGKFEVNYGTMQLGKAISPTASTYFRIASNTKTMTSAIVLQLAQEGKLKLSDRVSQYVEGVPGGDAITLAELLEMRSGLFNYTNDEEISTQIDQNPTREWTPQELLAIAFKHPPEAQPGTEFEYNNTNYVLLGLVIEKVDGKSLAVAMRDRLFAPLGMTSTLLPPASSSSLPTPYSHGYLYGSASVALVGMPPYSPELTARARAGKEPPKDYTNVNHSFAAAAGGVVSTADDLAVWIEALVSGRVLDAEYQRLWLESLRLENTENPDGQKYGFGIAFLHWGPNGFYFHGGETPGYNSFIGHDPTNRVTLIVWSNLTVSLDQSPTANSLMLKVLDEIYEVSPLTPAPEPAESR